MNNILLPKDSQGRWILRVDSSLLKGSNCARRTYLSAIRGLSKLEPSEAADYGTACHKVLDEWYSLSEESDIPEKMPSIDYWELCMNKGKDWFRANIPSPSSWRTLAHMTALMNSYRKEYQEHDGLVAEACEEKFEYLWYEDDTVVVYLCGTKDIRGSFNGEPVICDHKTHTPFGIGARDVLIDNFLNSFQTQIQGKVYVLHEQMANNKDYGFMINGLFLEKSGKNNFKRSEVFRWSEKDMAKFKLWLSERIDEIIFDFKEMLRLGDNAIAFLPNFTCCDGEKWPCDYRVLCLAPDEEHRALLEKLNYKAEERNPMKFGGDK